jgi:uncharacterized membrane protein
MYGSNFCGSGFGLGVGHGPWMLFILVLVLVSVAILFSRGRTSRPESVVNNRVDEALELLRRRYAAGELSEEDFQAMKIKLQA